MAASSMRRPGGIALLATLALAGAAPAQARSDWASGTYVFADLCTAAESGVRVGQRITLRRSPLGDALVYEAASLPDPIRTGDVALDPATKALDFRLETEGGEMRFHGTMAVDGLTGTVSDEAGTRPVHLPRILRPHAHDICPGETTGSLGPAR